jgi:hypothetical protein
MVMPGGKEVAGAGAALEMLATGRSDITNVVYGPAPTFLTLAASLTGGAL